MLLTTPTCRVMMLSWVLACSWALQGCSGRDSAIAELEKNKIAVTIDGLSATAAQGKVEMAKLLIKAGVNAKGKDARGSTPLIEASWAGQQLMVKLLLDEKADVNEPSGTAMTPLLAAVSQKHEQIALALLEGGANPNTLDAKGTSALMEAAWQGNLNVVKALIAKGANVRYVRAADSLTPLAMAQAAKQQTVVEALQAAGATP